MGRSAFARLQAALRTAWEEAPWVVNRCRLRSRGGLGRPHMGPREGPYPNGHRTVQAYAKLPFAASLPRYAAACRVNNSAYSPLRSINSSWVPRSTTFPWSST